MKIGLRVDVDTFKGTKKGVPQLMNTLNKYNVKASFFFSVGPDNMGRHLWRLLKPKFLIKMLKSNAVGLYGPGIIFQGTFFPGRKIAQNNKEVLIDCKNQGHEIGVHAWDHHYWQAHCEKMTQEAIEKRLDLCYSILSDILNEAPICSASPGFRCTDALIKAKEKYNFKYNCDCRGDDIFLPQIGDFCATTPQIPFSAPTYDEVIGRNGINNDNYNEYILNELIQGNKSVLTIHAEVEGGICNTLFDNFLCEAIKRGIEFCPLGELLEDNQELPKKTITRGFVEGREGWISIAQ